MNHFDFSTPTSTSVRIVRSFNAPLELVWRAHTEPELLKQWMTGPPGHSLPVCEVDLRVGGTARFVWKNPDFEMGMTAVFKEIVPHERIVHTEDYEMWPEGASTVTTSFQSNGDTTTITVDIEYQLAAGLEQATAPGFKDGYAASYDTLESLLPTL
ncbi:MAG: SRPBCC domain-containing protein [Planctomycetota bacterium]